MSQFFEILIFSQDIWGNVDYLPEINLISKGTLIKAFYLPSKTIKRLGLVEEKQLKTICQNKYFPKYSLHLFFPRNLLFRQLLRTSVFLNSKCLIFLYTFISLIKSMHSKTSLKEHTFLYLLISLFL